MSRREMDRREFIRKAAVLAAGAAVPGFLASCFRDSRGNPAKGRIPIGVQLYSVRDDCEKDFPGTMAAVAKAGYAGIEYAGYYGRSASDLRKMQDDRGLKCCGSHIGLDQLSPENLNATMDFHATIGNRFLVVPWMDEKYRKDKAAWLDAARMYNEVAEKVKARGFTVGYHAHAQEFEKYDGEVGWDILAGAVNPGFCMQMDTGNCLSGGGDPVAHLKRHPGKALTVHLKDYSNTVKDPLLGEGDVKWNEVFGVCETTGGTQWYIVEQEGYRFPPVECVAKCLENLRKMGK
jgi:sugar phosphate isomerase/epimerase